MTDLQVTQSELIRLGATVSIHRCPKCHQFLLTKRLADGVQVWCGMPNNICNNIGCNEGGFGKKEADAFDILSQKMNYSKTKP